MRLEIASKKYYLFRASRNQKTAPAGLSPHVQQFAGEYEQEQTDDKNEQS